MGNSPHQSPNTGARGLNKSLNQQRAEPPTALPSVFSTLPSHPAAAVFFVFVVRMAGPGRGDFRCKARNEGLAGPEHTFGYVRTAPARA